jgi:hypothetical protein
MAALVLEFAVLRAVLEFLLLEIPILPGLCSGVADGITGFID